MAVWEQHCSISQVTLHLSHFKELLQNTSVFYSLHPCIGQRLWVIKCPAFSFPFSSSCKRSQMVPVFWGQLLWRHKRYMLSCFPKISLALQGMGFLSSLMGRYCKCRTWLWEGKWGRGGSEVTALKWCYVIYKMSSFSQITAEEQGHHYWFRKLKGFFILKWSSCLKQAFSLP